MTLPLPLALAALTLEWAFLGWLSGINWPGRAARGAEWALRVLVGAFLLAVALLLCALTGVGFSQPALPLGVALLVAGLMRLIGHQPPVRQIWDWLSAADQADGKGSRLAQIPPVTTETAETGVVTTRWQIGLAAFGWLLLLLVLGAAAYLSWTIPEAGWDAFSHWGLKAKMFFLSGTVVNAGTEHEYYPPLVPLLEAWLYIHRGAVNIDEAKLVWAIFGVAFAVCLTGHLSQAMKPRWTAPYLGTAIVLGSMHWLEGMWTGQGDLALSAYLTLSILALFQWRRVVTGEASQWLFLAILLAGAAGLTKYEGLFRIGVVAVALALDGLLRRRGWRLAVLPPVTYLIGSLVIFAPWLAFRTFHAIAVDNEHIAGFQWQALPATLRALQDTLSGVRTGGPWIVVVLAVALGVGRVTRGTPRLLALVVAGELAATLLGFLLTNGPPERQVYVTGTRLLFHIAPTALFLAGLILVPLLGPTAQAVAESTEAASAGQVASTGQAAVRRT